MSGACLLGCSGLGADAVPPELVHHPVEPLPEVRLLPPRGRSRLDLCLDGQHCKRVSVHNEVVVANCLCAGAPRHSRPLTLLLLCGLLPCLGVEAQILAPISPPRARWMIDCGGGRGAPLFLALGSSAALPSGRGLQASPARRPPRAGVGVLEAAYLPVSECERAGVSDGLSAPVVWGAVDVVSRVAKSARVLGSRRVRGSRGLVRQGSRQGSDLCGCGCSCLGAKELRQHDRR